MAFIPPPRPAAVGFNLTPMIDVTVQLLIFFVCANTWSHAELSERLNLPAPIPSGRGAAEEDRPRFVINLRASGEIVVAGRQQSPERLAQLLREEVRRHGTRLDVLIRADKQVPYALTRAAIRACNQAGVSKVRFAVLREAT
jgi:biopolymer transport protein ExbD